MYLFIRLLKSCKTLLSSLVKFLILSNIDLVPFICTLPLLFKFIIANAATNVNRIVMDFVEINPNT